MRAPKLAFREVGPGNWGDFERLFAARGGPKSCWCMVWRATSAEARTTDGKSRKQAIHSRVRDGVPIGLLGYLADEPVAWCSIAPRSTYRRLGGPDDSSDADNTVWSLACFFIRRDLRGQGAGEQALNAAIVHARNKGGKVLEAYPVDPDSPSYRFMGFVGMFERAGFKTVGRAGTRRHVMRLSLG
ncbi:GNAT family N-acetyltransferase [Bradyrhizobium sp.]|uniref:GNAT family N-acetyltransferase n=1 Tax=Bradyrhizobium sp. TaxID=376 RepID=UPI003C773CDA